MTSAKINIQKSLFFSLNKHIFIDIQFQNSNSRNTASQGIRQDLCSYCTWLSPSRDIYRDQRVGVVGAEHRGHRGQGALIRIRFWASLSAGAATSSQGRTLFKNHIWHFLTKLPFPARILLVGRLLKKEPREALGGWWPPPGWQLGLG